MSYVLTSGPYKLLVAFWWNNYSNLAPFRSGQLDLLPPNGQEKAATERVGEQLVDPVSNKLAAVVMVAT